jgi:hypothetical protein
MEVEGTFLTLKELLVIFPRLKKWESHLSVTEHTVLNHIEKILYEYLSVQEIESPLEDLIEEP